MRRVFLSLVFVSLSSPAWAAYTTCTVDPISPGNPTGGIKRNDTGVVERVDFTCTGNAGEKPATFSYVPVGLSDTEEALRVRRERDRVLALLNNKAAFSALPALQPGQAIPAAPAPIVTPPTAVQIWATAQSRLSQLIDARAALTAASVAIPAALTADIAELAAIVDDYANDLYLGL